MTVLRDNFLKKRVNIFKVKFRYILKLYIFVTFHKSNKEIFVKVRSNFISCLFTTDVLNETVRIGLRGVRRLKMMKWIDGVRSDLDTQNKYEKRKILIRERPKLNEVRRMS